MLTNKEICENFEVQLNTLYNWKKTKPKLFKYIQNADYNFEKSGEINVLLGEYAKGISKNFTIDEIIYFINSRLKATTINEIKNIHKIFIKAEYKQIPKQLNFIMSIYDKLVDMNLIEKYIFYKRTYKIRVKKLIINEELIVENFSEYLLKKEQ